MATKATAKEKYVRSVIDPIALHKMTTKLSTYLEGTVTEASAPVRNWKEIVARRDHAEVLFERCWGNMRVAYGIM